MLDIAPHYWTPIFYNFLGIFCFIKSFQTLHYGLRVKMYSWKFMTFLVFISVWLFLGFRPLQGGGFGDMYIYLSDFNKFKQNIIVESNRDFLWRKYMQYSSQLLSPRYFILLSAFLYVYPLYKGSIALSKRYGFYMFLMIVASFTFWPYGTNGMRNGIATSFFFLAITGDFKLTLRLCLMLVAYLIHGSMILPIMAYLGSFLVKDVKFYFYGWLASIFISLVAGGFLQTLFYGFSFLDNRVDYLVQGNINNDTFRYTGFRWDFVLFSASAVYASYRYVYILRFKDMVYNTLLKIFLFTNSFWILIIRANFSNRFAYLSWFLMASILFYPLLNQNFSNKRSLYYGSISLVYVGFTYIMYLIS